jgi:hypothetical protein
VDRRRSRRKLLQGLSGLLGSTGRRVGLLRRRYGGQGDPGITSGEESRGRSRIPAVVLGLDSGAGRARGQEWKPRGASWQDGEAALGLGRS